MKKKRQKLTRTKNKEEGFNNLIDVHTNAIEKNSNKIVEALEALSDKHLSYNEMKQLKSIRAALNRLNKDIDKI